LLEFSVVYAIAIVIITIASVAVIASIAVIATITSATITLLAIGDAILVDVNLPVDFIAVIDAVSVTVNVASPWVNPTPLRWASPTPVLGINTAQSTNAKDNTPQQSQRDYTFFQAVHRSSFLRPLEMHEPCQTKAGR
jgi:hypothetical protein